MKKIFLCFLLLFPTELLAQENMAQGIFRRMVLKNDVNDSDVSDKLFTPKFRGQLVMDFDLDNNYQSTNRQNEYKNAYTRGRLAGKFEINRNFSVNGMLRLRQSQTDSQKARRADQVDGGGSTSFQNEVLYLQEFTLNYDRQNFSLVAGKFTQNFGRAWLWGRGIWSNDLAKNYRQLEKLGVGGVYKMGDAKKTGRYVFGFSTFTNDRKNFDNSLISNRDSNTKSDAKAGDTRSLKSYVASTDILFDFSDKEKLSYHFAYIDLGVNSRFSSVAANKIDDQKGYVATMNYRYPVSENFLLDSLLEYVKMKNIDGNSDISEQYTTASFVGEIYRQWNITLSTSNLAHRQIDQDGYDRNLSEISFGYTFDKTDFFDKLLLQVGYKNFRTNYKTSVDVNNSVGVMLRYFKSI